MLPYSKSVSYTRTSPDLPIKAGNGLCVGASAGKSLRSHLSMIYNARLLLYHWNMGFRIDVLILMREHCQLTFILTIPNMWHVCTHVFHNKTRPSKRCGFCISHIWMLDPQDEPDPRGPPDPWGYIIRSICGIPDSYGLRRRINPSIGKSFLQALFQIVWQGWVQMPNSIFSYACQLRSATVWNLRHFPSNISILKLTHLALK